ncbi:glutamine cyclotransferase [Planktosalinus lacus]|uniref:Glutamine cyclotransferase n=2 Tax=Planktosalinus lacus TaxID=1526573 RepID=A0A8J2V886_9FLAO|nr:glutamine cyclotransferase [Planktosalinus lacus]
MYANYYNSLINTQMKFYVAFFFFLTLLFFSCGSQSETKNFTIVVENAKPSFSNNQIISVTVKNPNQKEIDSITYFIDQNQMGKTIENTSFSIPLENQKLGNRRLQATVYFNNNTETATKDLYVLASEKPKLYSYKILNEYPHDMEAYTQGLEFHDDTLYEGTGQYGNSSLRKTNYKTGEVLQNIPLESNYFGEGITILDNKIYQLTWRENVGFIYNLKTLEKTGSFIYSKSEEGWGLCNDGNTIYKSDGTEKIWTLNKENLTEESYIEIYTNTSRIKSVNELEWVDGKIYANIFQKNAIAIINPLNGAVEGVIDLGGLQARVTQHRFLDVLNGIAYKGEPNKLFVTGKNWDKLFEIEIIEKQ